MARVVDERTIVHATIMKKRKRTEHSTTQGQPPTGRGHKSTSDPRSCTTKRLPVDVGKHNPKAVSEATATVSHSDTSASEAGSFKVKVEFPVTENMRRRVESLVARRTRRKQRCSKSDVCRLAVERYLGEEESKPPPWFVVLENDDHHTASLDFRITHETKKRLDALILHRRRKGFRWCLTDLYRMAVNRYLDNEKN